MKKVLLLGGGGYIGSWLAGEFESRGHQVRIVDPMFCLADVPEDIKKKSIAFRAGMHKAMIEEKSFSDIAFRDVQNNPPDIIINLMGTPIDKPENDSLVHRQLEIDIPLNLRAIKLAKLLPNTRFVFMSSPLAYGDFDWSITEDHFLNPITPYGIMKATGEFMLKQQLENWNIIRTASVYGMGDWNWRATQIFVNRLLLGEKLLINDIWLDFIYIKDLVRGIADVALSDKKNEAFHISGGKALSLVDFVNELKVYFPNAEFDIYSVQDRPKRGTLDNTKARVMLGWQPEYDLKRGLEDYIMNYVKKEVFA